MSELTCLSSLLNVESVCDEEEVWVNETQRLREILLNSCAGVEDEFDPALMSLISNVVLQWSSDLALACKGSVDESIEESRFKSRHITSQIFIINKNTTLARNICLTTKSQITMRSWKYLQFG